MSKKIDALMALLAKSDPTVFAQAQAILDAESVSTSNRAKITDALPGVLASGVVKGIIGKYAKLAKTVKVQESKLDDDKKALVDITGEFVRAIASQVKVDDAAKYLQVIGAQVYDPELTWLAPVTLIADSLGASVRERKAIVHDETFERASAGFELDESVPIQNEHVAIHAALSKLPKGFGNKEMGIALLPCGIKDKSGNARDTFKRSGPGAESWAYMLKAYKPLKVDPKAQAQAQAAHDAPVQAQA